MPLMEGFLSPYLFYGGGGIDKTISDRFDLIGGMIAIVGVFIIMYAPRQ